MARILCVTSGLRSMLHASLELACRLQSDGHEVVYASTARVGESVGEHGLAFEALSPSGYATFLEEDRRRGPLARALGWRRRRAAAARAMEPRDFGELLRRLEPDLVLLDIELHEHIALALAGGVRLALLNTFVSIWRRPGLPPPHRLVRPGVGWKGRPMGLRLLWWDLRIRKARRRWSLRLRHLGCDRVSVLGRYAGRLGVDLAAEVDSRQWLIPFVWERPPVLCLHAQELEFAHEPPPGVHYVGPMVRDANLLEESPAALDAVLARRRAGGATRLIYAGFGSFFSVEREVVRRLIEAVAGRADWELVLTLGGRLAPEALGALPRNVHAFSWVPQVRVLGAADVAVTHGGASSMCECVASGVPVLVYCGFETDMAGVAARAVHHGIGLLGDADRDDAERMRVHLDRLLDDRTFRDNVARLRSAFAAYSSERVLEGVVERLLSEPSEGSRR